MVGRLTGTQEQELMGFLAVCGPRRVWALFAHVPPQCILLVPLESRNPDARPKAAARRVHRGTSRTHPGAPRPDPRLWAGRGRDLGNNARILSLDCYNWTIL